MQFRLCPLQRVCSRHRLKPLSVDDGSSQTGSLSPLMLLALRSFIIWLCSPRHFSLASRSLSVSSCMVVDWTGVSASTLLITPMATSALLLSIILSGSGPSSGVMPRSTQPYAMSSKSYPCILSVERAWLRSPSLPSGGVCIWVADATVSKFISTSFSQNYRLICSTEACVAPLPRQ